VSHLLFAASEQLSTRQRKDINAQEATKAVSLASSFFHRMRSDADFSGLYKATVKEAENLTQPPMLPRHRKVPQKIDSGGSAHQFQTAEDY